MQAAHLKVEDLQGARVLRFSQPAKKNALTREILSQLVSALSFSEQEAERDDIRCVILTGDSAGHAFSAGFDIRAIDDDERARGLDPIEDAACAIESCVVPVVAAIDGPMFGGAFELAMACDVRFMGALSSCGMPPARLGLVYSAAGLKRFLRASSLSRCQKAFLSAQSMNAEQALAAGFVDEIAEKESAFDLALAFAEQIKVGAPLAVNGMLQGLRMLGRSDEKAEAFIAEKRAKTLRSDDLQEGISAFHERRSSQFKGR